jgi:Tol biopolymer transport system component
MADKEFLLRRIFTKLWPHAVWRFVEWLTPFIVSAAYVIWQKVRHVDWNLWVFAGLFLFALSAVIVIKFRNSIFGPKTSEGDRPERRKKAVLRGLVVCACIALLLLGMRHIFGGLRPGGAPKTAPMTGLFGFEEEPSFSPDGSEIVYTWDGGNHGTRGIYLKRLGPSTPLRLTSETEGNVESPAWSSDGQRIAYVRPVADKAQIWEVPSLTGPTHQLGETFLYPSHLNRHPGLTSSPDGLYLAAPNNGSVGNPPGIFLFSTKTGDWSRLTTAKYGDCQPSFSPDGQQIAFVREFTLGIEDLYTVPVAGGEPRRLTVDQRIINGAAWTPNGREIVFASNRAGEFALWRIDSSGGEPRSMPVTADFLANPSISRRGNRLAYVRESSNTNIWSLRMSAAGSVLSPPVKSIYSSKEETSPQYSPNGERVVFVSTRTGSSEIWLCEWTGSNPIRLTKFDGPITGTPRWSPDGQQIVFDSRPSGESRIYVIRAEGVGTSRRVTSGPGEDTVPSWSRDGKWIFFASTRSGLEQIWKVPVVGGEAVQLTLQGGFAPLPSRDGKFLYYAKGSTKAGLWRVPTEGGAESSVTDDLEVSFWGQWAVTDSGIYFMSLHGKKGGGIQFFRFATQKVEHIFTPEKPPIQWTDGLDVSPDGSTILYTQVDQRITNVMLMENFR